MDLPPSDDPVSNPLDLPAAKEKDGDKEGSTVTMSNEKDSSNDNQMTTSNKDKAHPPSAATETESSNNTVVDPSASVQNTTSDAGEDAKAISTSTAPRNILETASTTTRLLEATVDSLANLTDPASALPRAVSAAAVAASQIKPTANKNPKNKVQTRGKKINLPPTDSSDAFAPSLSSVGDAAATAPSAGVGLRRKRRSSANSSVTSAASSLVAATSVASAEDWVDASTGTTTDAHGAKPSGSRLSKSKSKSKNNSGKSKGSKKGGGSDGGMLGRLHHPAKKSQQQGLPRVQVRDLNEKRIVNPLTEWPSHPQYIVPGTTGGASSASNNKDKDTAAQQEHASEVMPLLDLWQPIPDSYPISYQARLLGFDVKVPNVWHHSSAQHGGDLPPTPLPRHLTFVRDEASHQFIPPLGRFAQQVWQNTSREYNTNGTAKFRALACMPCEDVAILGDHYDPLYKALVVIPSAQSLAAASAQSTAASSATAATDTPPAKPPPTYPLISYVSTQHYTRLMIQFSKARPQIQATFRLAQSLLQGRENNDSNAGGIALNNNMISPDWTVCTWSEYETRFPSTTLHNNSSHIVGLCILPRPLPPMPPPSEQPLDPAAPPTVRPLVIIWYTFTWYHYQAGSPSSFGNQQTGLVLHIHDLSVPSQCTLFNAVPTPPSPDDDSTNGPEELKVSDMSFLEQTWVVMAICFAFEHARAANVHYAISDVPPYLRATLETFFRMVCARQDSPPPPQPERQPPAASPHALAASSIKMPAQQESTGDSAGTRPQTPVAASNRRETAHHSVPQTLPGPIQKIRMVADLEKASSKLALLILKQAYQTGTNAWLVPAAPKQPEANEESQKKQFRSIVRFPNEPDAQAMTKENPADRLRRAATRKPSTIFGNATQPTHKLAVALKVKLPDEDQEDDKGSGDDSEEETSLLEFYRVDPWQRVDEVRIEPPVTYEEPTLEVLRTFAIQPQPAAQDTEDDEIVRLMKQHSKEVSSLELGVEPKARRLLQCVVDERMEFESKSNALQEAEQEKIILAKFRKAQADRKQRLQEEQEQLEQDMNAVCCICDDGEVTPENQILFCDTCDVPVHQMCYGVERVPAGDYHCIACCFLGRNKEGRKKYLDKSKKHVKPLPIVCELCPQKHGAYVRTQVKSAADDPNGRWVHSICAKWQGLDYVKKDRPELVEDVTELKRSFRLQKIKCDLCLGERGCMNKCRKGGCNRWLHVTCAMSVGKCTVTQGENYKGESQENPWTLLCPEHSEPDIVHEPKTPMTVEELIDLAKSLPPEPVPEPEKEKVPFNKASREEQTELMNDPEYEKLLIHEITMNRSMGVRCEICDQGFDNAKDIHRCNQCRDVICKECILTTDTGGENTKCLRCKTENADKASNENATPPSCVGCFCKHGPLRPCFAKPMNMSRWRKYPVQFEKSLFKTAKWIHSLCGLWTPWVFMSQDEAGKFDLSNVVMGHGNSFTNDRHPCFVCGKTFGLKLRCYAPGCQWKEKNGTEHPTFFHVTCARHAGLEVAQGEDPDDPNNEGIWYVKCYRHGGNEFNLRAKLEDLYEIEKLRAEKRGKNAALTFPDGSKIINAAITVVKILGWSWRWAEWFVDYDSTWEPLLEPGQKESQMTKEELRIVDSTRESRCADARKCRLIAFGAALRDRLYDEEDDFDRVALDRALRAILNIKSLVGPLKKEEIDFHVEWLGRAYRSKSKLLNLGEEQFLVEEHADFCVDRTEGKPKFRVDASRVPGKQKPTINGIFEATKGDIDDFLKTDIMVDPAPPVRNRNKKRNRSIGGEKSSVGVRDASGKSANSKDSESAPRKRRCGPGRPPRYAEDEDVEDEKPQASSKRKRDRSRDTKTPVVERKGGPGRPSRSTPSNNDTVRQRDAGHRPARSTRAKTPTKAEGAEPQPIRKKRGRPPKRKDPDPKTLAVQNEDDGFGFKEFPSDTEKEKTPQHTNHDSDDESGRPENEDKKQPPKAAASKSETAPDDDGTADAKVASTQSRRIAETAADKVKLRRRRSAADVVNMNSLFSALHRQRQQSPGRKSEVGTRREIKTNVDTKEGNANDADNQESDERPEAKAASATSDAETSGGSEDEGDELNAMDSVKKRRRTPTARYPGFVSADSDNILKVEKQGGDRRGRRRGSAGRVEIGQNAGNDSQESSKEDTDDNEDQKQKAKRKSRDTSGGWPLTDIVEPHENDVIFGVNGKTHPGNIRFRDVVLEREEEHNKTTKPGRKAQICQEIVIAWREGNDPPGRFLDQDEETKLWEDVGNKRAGDKARKTFRR